MALDDVIINHVKIYGGASWKFEEISKKPEDERKYSSEDIDLFLAYSEHPVSPSERALIHRTPEREIDPELNEDLPNVKGRADEKLKGVVSANYVELLNEMGINQLLYTVDKTDTKNVEGNTEYNQIVDARNTYKEWEQNEKTGNIEYYKEHISNPILKKAVAIANEVELKPLMTERVSIEKSRFLTKFASGENLDEDKLKGYISTAINSEEEVANSVYINLGQAYAVVRGR